MIKSNAGLPQNFNINTDNGKKLVVVVVKNEIISRNTRSSITAKKISIWANIWYNKKWFLKQTVIAVVAATTAVIVVIVAVAVAVAVVVVVLGAVASMMTYHQQFITSLHSSVNLCSSTFNYLRHKDAIVTNDMLIAYAASNAETKTCIHQHRLSVKLDKK